jgi:hypothetical protein
MSDDAVSHVVGHWLDEGPSAAPSELLDAALRSVAGTPQLRPLPGLLRMVPASGPALGIGLAGVALAASLVLAVGLGLGGDDQPGIVPTPSPDASGEASSAGLSLYRNDLDGYQLLVPDAWEGRTYEPIPDGVRMFGSGLDQPYPALTMSIGRPDGGVQICRTARCELVQATTLDELGEVLRASPPELDRPEQRADTVLGGVAARVEWIRTGSIIWAPVPAFRYVYTIHEGRPVVLAFDHWLNRCLGCGDQFKLTNSVLDEIIGSFEFLDGFGEPPPAVGEELVFPEAGVAFALVGALRDVVAVDRSTIEISGARDEAVVLIGNDDGQVRTCTRSAGPWEECRVITADSIEDLALAIRPGVGSAYQDGIAVPGRVETATVQLGGEEATSITIEDYEYPAGGGETIRYVLAMDDGRPIVLRLYSPAAAFAPPWMADFLATFRFLD